MSDVTPGAAAGTAGEMTDWACRAVAAVRRRASGPALEGDLRVTLNFHPDRLTNGRTVLAQMAEHGTYRSQFETGTSAGGLSAHPGGDRWRWEQRIFDGAYDDAPPAQRPKYGALNHRRRSIGAAPRFGSAHLRLARHTLARTTFCFPDSVLNPQDFATAQSCDLIPLAEEFAATPRTEAQEAALGGALDDYIEAHVHGPIHLATDVEALVLDLCYAGTLVQDQAHALGVPVEWHEGRVLTVAELRRHPDFRGAGIVAVGEQIAEGGRLDAAVIGRAAATGRAHEQDLKRVWHLVARFGR